MMSIALQDCGTLDVPPGGGDKNCGDKYGADKYGRTNRATPTPAQTQDQAAAPPFSLAIVA